MHLDTKCIWQSDIAIVTYIYIDNLIYIISTVEPRYLELAYFFRITAYLEVKIWSLF